MSPAVSDTPTAHDLDVEFVTLPEPTVVQRILWSNDERNRFRPLHSRVFTEYLLGVIPPLSMLLFIIEESPLGSPFAQLARARDRYLVDTNYKGEDEMWTMGLHGASPQVMVELPAPWLKAESIPAFDRNVLDRTTAADCVWSWMRSQTRPHGIVGEPCLRGPHRRPFAS